MSSLDQFEGKLERITRYKISKVGNSFKITVPPDLFELWGINTEDEKKAIPEVYIYAQNRVIDNKDHPVMIVSVEPLTWLDKARAEQVRE